jgi:hypothetical protein
MGSIIGEFTSSIYVKADGYSIIDYGVFNSTASNYPVRAVFDLSTQTITQINGSISSITSVGSGWYRISVTASVASTSTMSIYHRVRSTGTSGNYAGDGTSGMLLWGCQLESGVITPYIGPTTTAAVSVGPVSNVPRLDYLGSSCPRLLLEPQRSNLSNYSEQFNNAEWTGDRYTINANAATSPDGYSNADLFRATTDTGTHNLNKTTLINLGGVAGTMSVFAKYNGYNISLSIAGSSLAWTGCVFDLQNGVAKTPQQGGPQTACTAKIENYGNGWYRCSISYTPYASGAFFTFFGSVSSANATLGAYGLEEYTGNGTSGFYLYGAQVEQGAYATSYIPTLAASVTRVTDAAYKTSISSLLSASVGTLFVEVERQGPSGADPENLIFISDTSLLNFVNIVYDTTTNRYRAQVREGGVTTGIAATTSPYTGKIKIAAAWEANNLVLYINGVLQATDTSVTVPTVTFDSLALGSYYDGSYGPDSFRGSFSQALVFKTRLTNAQLAELTTL